MDAGSIIFFILRDFFVSCRTPLLLCTSCISRLATVRVSIKTAPIKNVADEYLSDVKDNLKKHFKLFLVS